MIKVKSLYPTIVTENLEETKKFYQTLGFEMKHNAVTTKNSTVCVLANGDMQIEVIEKAKDAPIELKNGLYSLRMNVEDIDQAYNELKDKGCTIVVPPFETTVGKNMIVRDELGVNITIVQHIKKN